MNFMYKAAKSIDLEFTSGCTIKEKEQGGIFYGY